MLDSHQIRLFLEKSLDLAQQTLHRGNYPIGALFVDLESGTVVAEATNECTTHHDITAHAEIVGIRNLGQKANKDTNPKLALFTSLEPCFGCSFFLARTNVTHIYSALKDPHKGGLLALQQQEQFFKFFKDITVQNDLFDDLKEKSQQLMQDYFLNIGRKDAAKFYGFTE